MNDDETFIKDKGHDQILRQFTLMLDLVDDYFSKVEILWQRLSLDLPLLAHVSTHSQMKLSYVLLGGLYEYLNMSAAEA